MIKLATNKTFTKVQRKKIKIKRIRTNLKITIYVKLELMDKIPNQDQIYIKRPRINIKNQKNKDQS
jgi:hypothetical protein